jgi:hypothetical protein
LTGEGAPFPTQSQGSLSLIGRGRLVHEEPAAGGSEYRQGHYGSVMPAEYSEHLAQRHRPAAGMTLKVLVGGAGAGRKLGSSVMKV